MPTLRQARWTALHQVAWTRRPNIHKTPAAVPSGNMDSLTFVKVLVAHGDESQREETKEPRDGKSGKLQANLELRLTCWRRNRLTRS